jgi:hypothetical protein
MPVGDVGDIFLLLQYKIVGFLVTSYCALRAVTSYESADARMARA